MYKVRVKGEGVKLANKWCFVNDIAIIDKEEYEKNKDYVEVLEEIKEGQNPEGEKNSSNDSASSTNVDSNKKEEQENSGENAEKENEEDDKELEALKEKAKELGINVTHNMKKETIIKKIEEKEAETGEGQNPDGE